MLVVPAYAKVNLALEVTGRRPDGWHDVATVIAAVDWHDLVGIELLPGDPGDIRICVTGPFAEGVPADDSNLAVRAARLLLRLAGDPPQRVDIRLRKEVPSAAGLGGGSADAAAVLRAGASLLRTSAADLQTAAAELGSDVPAVLAGGTTFATGRGDQLTALPSAHLHLAIAVAGPSATQAAYHALTDAERAPNGSAHALAKALEDHRPIDPGLLGSALEPPACRAAPGLRDSLARLRALTPTHAWHLTGSGGAAFALAPDAPAAARLAATAHHAGFPARACRTLTRRLLP